MAYALLATSCAISLVHPCSARGERHSRPSDLVDVTQRASGTSLCVGLRSATRRPVSPRLPLGVPRRSGYGNVEISHTEIPTFPQPQLELEINIQARRNPAIEIAEPGDRALRGQVMAARNRPSRLTAQLSLLILLAGLNKRIDDEALRQEAHRRVTNADEKRIVSSGHARDAPAESCERSRSPATNVLITAQGRVDRSIAFEDKPESDRVFQCLRCPLAGIWHSGCAASPRKRCAPLPPDVERRPHHQVDYAAEGLRTRSRWP